MSLRHLTMLQRYQNLVLAICVSFMREVKALSSLHICTGSHEPSALDNVTTLPKSRARNMRVIYARSEGSVESAYLHRLT